MGRPHDGDGAGPGRVGVTDAQIVADRTPVAISANVSAATARRYQRKIANECPLEVAQQERDDDEPAHGARHEPPEELAS